MVENDGLIHTPHTVLDPTSRTLDTLHREIENVSDRLETLIISEARLSKERAEAVKLEFMLVERQRIEQKLDTKQAVDAALIAQKEAVREQTLASEKSIAKSEAATAKQIDAQSVSFSQAFASLTLSLNDQKDRIVAIEAGANGRTFEHDQHRLTAGQNTNIITAVIIAVGALASTLIAIHG